MTITHFGHACLVYESDTARLLIDPGTLSTGFSALTDLSAILITHEHADHVDAGAVRALLIANPSAQLVLDEVTAGQFPELAPTIAHPGETLTIAGERIEVLGGIHALVYGDIPGCPNLAYLIGDGALLHPGDSFYVPDRPIDTLAVPIDGPWLKLSEAVDYVHAVQPTTILPIHEGELTDVAKYVGMLDAFTTAEA